MDTNIHTYTITVPQIAAVLLGYYLVNKLSRSLYWRYKNA